ncbi:sulfatase family protein [Pelagicoccus mobilis]|uniref:Sulfatase n=1 Tax=Pelagicoccus mobilis TaxID=415221 RepID=A0A934VM04_9BACT|nr:sulfatase [Pelagicoccus mobilis]MBK1878331.1 sulfatase [Pelagicoccus mobilis]
MHISSLFLAIVVTVSLHASNRPNIILILTDDQRGSAIGASGNEIIHTPNMDQLAEEGIYFKNAFVTTPICAASRASIFTGLYERTHDFTFRTPPLAERFIDISFPKLLRDAGYRTGLFGKLGVRFENNAQREIFDELYDTSPKGYFRLHGEGWAEHEHLTDRTTRKAIEFIEATPTDQPFCVSLSYNAPHADDTTPLQFFWPERNDHLYQDIEIPYDELHAAEYFEKLPAFVQAEDTLARIRHKWRFDTPEKYQRMVKGYYRMISTIDDNLGQLRSYLGDKGLAQNTIILFIGDNGYFLGERGLSGKWLMYENSLHVPLIVYDPSASQEGTVSQIGLNIDIAPTILDYAGIEAPALTQGESLRPFTGNAPDHWRSEFICEHLYELPFIPKSEGIRTEEWKYFRYIDQEPTEELYHLASDPKEQINLADDPSYADTLDRLRRKLETQTAALNTASQN